MGHGAKFRITLNQKSETNLANNFEGETQNFTIAVGENSVIYQTSNGANWTGINEVSVVSINGFTDQLNIREY